MTKEKFEPFDLAEYATASTTQAFLLESALELGDPAHIANVLGIIARARGMTETAKKAGVTREGLYKALSKTGDPRLSTFLGVVGALGYKIDLVPAKPLPAIQLPDN
jgi:probable addiction module antidote protein